MEHAIHRISDRNAVVKAKTDTCMLNHCMWSAANVYLVNYSANIYYRSAFHIMC